MSKTTNPILEASVSCGFYNGADRTYEAREMTQIVDGIINDGVFASIGTCFVVKASSGRTVNVGVGKAWFNSTYTLNDAVLPIDCEESEVLLNRIDAIIIEVDARESVRDNFIKVIKGEPASNPVNPVLNTTSNVFQYPLCYIYRRAGSNEILQMDITNMVGSTETPFVTGILQTVSLDELLGQWQDDLDRFMAKTKADANTEINTFVTTSENDYNKWYAEMVQTMEDAVTETMTWTESQRTTILDWFNNMKNQLSVDGAINLQLQIDNEEIERILLCGFVDGVKEISEDGLEIVTQSTDGRALISTFSSDFTSLTTSLYDAHGTRIARIIKTFSEDGRTITSETDIVDVSLVNGDEIEY